MKMVSTVKLAKFNCINKYSKTCAERLFEMFSIAVMECIYNEEFLHEHWFNRTNGKKLILVFSTDQGFCGSFNQLITEKAFELAKLHEGAYIEVFGKKRNPINQNSCDDISLDRPTSLRDISCASEMLSKLTFEYVLTHNVTDVYIVSGEFQNAIVQKAKVSKILPVNEIQAVKLNQTEIEGNRLEFIDDIFRMYLSKILTGLITEHLISEFSARVMTMDNSVKSAKDMSGNLKTLYNRIRQDKITQELTEIVSSMEAVR
jgi:F-type H+-transporting ATPase subunit gamma